jgi:hypothetical protein
MSTLFLAWHSGKGISIVVFPTLVVLGSEVLYLEVLDPVSRFSSEVLMLS